MKRLTIAVALAVALTPALAQATALSATNIPSREDEAASVTSPPRSETTGGDKQAPEPHIYRLGEHLSDNYGTYELVDKWDLYHLKMPPEGHHWVRYGENFMLVTNTDGLIKMIVSTSEAPRASAAPTK